MIILYWLGLTIVWHDRFALSAENPCKFYDSIDISNGNKISSGSIIFDKVEYSPDFIFEANETLFNGTLVPSKPHIRGCLCKIRNCIRLCCTDLDNCSNEPLYSITNITNRIDNYEKLFEHLVPINGTMCMKMSNVENWTLEQVKNDKNSYLIL